MLADRIEHYLSGAQEIFVMDVPEHVEKLAQHFSERIQHQGFSYKNEWQEKEQVVAKKGDEDFQEVDLQSIEMEDVREVGAEWLCKQTLEELGVGDFLRSLNWSERQVETALIQLISRAVYPASERKTILWIKENSAVSELFNRPEVGWQCEFALRSQLQGVIRLIDVIFTREQRAHLRRSCGNRRLKRVCKGVTIRCGVDIDRLCGRTQNKAAEQGGEGQRTKHDDYP